MAKKRGSYLGESTVIGPRSGWFTHTSNYHERVDDEKRKKLKILKEKRELQEEQRKLEYKKKKKEGKLFSKAPSYKKQILNQKTTEFKTGAITGIGKKNYEYCAK